MIIKFIGTEAEIHGKKLERFGQAIEMPDAEAMQAIAGNAPVLPAADFDACGFTPAELDRYAYPAARAECSADFAAKWQAARRKLHDLREQAKEAVNVG